VVRQGSRWRRIARSPAGRAIGLHRAHNEWWRLSFIVVLSASAFLLLRWGGTYPKDAWPRDALLVIIGGIVALAGGLIVSLVERSEAYKQGSYTERAKAVQDVLATARRVKSNLFPGYWEQLRHEPSSGRAYEIVASMKRDELAELLRQAFHHRVWIGEPGVDAVRRFNRETASVVPLLLDLAMKEQRDLAETTVNEVFDRLELALLDNLEG